MNLIRKKPHTCKISEFRPIAILSVVYKVYSKCLLKLALCTCVFACLRSLCFTDGVKGRSDGGRQAGFFLITWSGVLVYWCHCVHVSLYT